MSATLRAFYGALVGALAVLLLHPYSRPYLTQGVWFLGGSPYLRETQLLPENLKTLPEPKSLEDAGLWVVTACQRDLSGDKLNEDELLLLLEVVQATAVLDPDNAFWRQAEAIFQWRLGNHDAALRAWETASLAGRWNDYQNSRLDAVLDGLARENGRNLGWHYGLADSRKSHVVARCVLAFSRQALRGERAHDFALRMATLWNGRLLRDGSRSIEGSLLGVDVIDLSAYAPLQRPIAHAGPSGPVSPRMLTTARDDLLRAVHERLPEQEQLVKDVYRENDARSAFIRSGDTDPYKRLLVLTSVLSATLPGALVAIGLIGAAIYLFGWAVGRARPLQRVLTPPWTQILGVAIGLGVYFSTGLFFPALWAAVSLCSFGIRRDDERQAVPAGLGTAYALTIAILAAGFALVLALYFVSRSAPGDYVFEEAGVISGPVLSEWALVGLAGVVASLALVTAPVWGFLARVPAERLAGPSLARFGAAVALGCLAAGVVLAPVAIGVDRAVGDQLSKIYQNEPTFYLTQ
jgi:hypothetical protein